MNQGTPAFGYKADISCDPLYQLGMSAAAFMRTAAIKARIS
jgi:hypothetical protein